MNSKTASTYSTLLLVLPFMNAGLTPTMNYPFGGSVSNDYGVVRSALYEHAVGVPDENSQYRILEEFATRLLAKTEDLDVNIARAFQEDFLYLYESV